MTDNYDKIYHYMIKTNYDNYFQGWNITTYNKEKPYFKISFKQPQYLDYIVNVFHKIY